MNSTAIPSIAPSKYSSYRTERETSAACARARRSTFSIPRKHRTRLCVDTESRGARAFSKPDEEPAAKASPPRCCRRSPPRRLLPQGRARVIHWDCDCVELPCGLQIQDQPFRDKLHKPRCNPDVFEVLHAPEDFLVVSTRPRKTFTPSLRDTTCRPTSDQSLDTLLFASIRRGNSVSGRPDSILSIPFSNSVSLSDIEAASTDEGKAGMVYR